MKSASNFLKYLAALTAILFVLACSDMSPQSDPEAGEAELGDKGTATAAELEKLIHIDVSPRGEVEKSRTTSTRTRERSDIDENYLPPDPAADDGFTEEMIDQHEEQMQEPTRVRGSVDTSRPSFDIGPDSGSDIIQILPKERETRFRVGLHPEFQPGTYQIYAIWSRNDNPLPQAQHGISSLTVRFLNDQTGADGYDRNVKFDVENVTADGRSFDTTGKVLKGDNVNFPAAHPPGSEGYAQRMRAVERGLWNWNGDYSVQFSEAVEGDGEGQVGAAREISFRLRGDEGHEDVMVTWVETDGKKYTLYSRLRLSREWEEFRILANVEASVLVNTMEGHEDSSQCLLSSDDVSNWKSVGIYYLSEDAYVTINNRNIFQYNVESQLKLVPIYDPELNQTEAFRCLGGALSGHGLRH